MSNQTPKPQHQTPSASSQHTRLKDFSVESQRRNFIAEQERERAAQENRRSGRRVAKATAANNNAIALSGMMSRLDDDDSVGSCSVGSEESFYVGIERADYTSPDNFEMYGEEEKGFVEKEDRLGIGRVNVSSWDDKDLVIVHEESSSLYQFMTGGKTGEVNTSTLKKDVLVAMPLVVDDLQYKGNLIGEEDHSQVYQQEAAEGKMFIDKLVSGEASAGEEASTVADIVNQPATTPGKNFNNTPFTTPGTQKTAREGHYPVISPMALFSPYLNQVSSEEGEDNAMRQLREREIRKDANEEAKKQYDEKLNKLQRMIDSLSEDGFPVSELKRQVGDLLASDEFARD